MTTLVDQRAGYGPPAPVPIFQWAAEFEVLLDMYRERQPRRVLEIGTYHGGTLYHWLQNAVEDAVVVSVDSYKAGVDNRRLYRSWLPSENVGLEVIEGNSRDPAVVTHVHAYGPYDWVFIDGGHFYHEVLADWELYGLTAGQGALVALHDILPPTVEHPEIEVARLWEDIKASGYETVEIVADPGADWGGIGVVYL